MSLDEKLPLISHIIELKRRLIICLAAIGIMFIPAYIYYDVVIEVLSAPFQSLSGQPFIITSIFEGFFTKMKLSFFLGAVLASPVILFQMLRFIFPGLKKKEKRLILVSLFFSLILALSSLYMGYTKILPLSIQFLTSMEFIPEKAGIFLHFKDNIFFVFNALLAGVLAFQLPIVLEALLYLNVLKRRQLWKASRYVILLIFVGAALITPPDIISQLSVALPMIVLYFLTLIIAKIFKFGEDTCSDSV